MTPAWHRRAGSPPALFVTLPWACGYGQVWAMGTRGNWSPSALRVLLLRAGGEQRQASCAGKAAQGGAGSSFVLLPWEPRWLAGPRVPQQAAAPEGGEGLSLRQGMFQSRTFTGSGTPARCSAPWPGLGSDSVRVWCGAKRHLRCPQLRGQDRGLTGMGGSADCQSHPEGESSCHGGWAGKMEGRCLQKGLFWEEIPPCASVSDVDPTHRESHHGQNC